MVHIVIVSLGISLEALQQTTDRVHSVLSGVEHKVFISMHSALDADNVHAVQNGISGATVVTLNSGNFGMAYASGLLQAVSTGNPDVVIDMDSGGGHLPDDLAAFIYPPKNGAVFGSRFHVRGAENRYPLPRKLVSLVGTVLSHVFLGTWGILDATSGFEAYDATVLKKLFLLSPPETWVSCQENMPFHLINTELRAKVLALTGMPRIKQVPIRYGVEKKGKSLPASYLLSSMLGLLKLRHELKSFKTKID